MSRPVLVVDDNDDVRVLVARLLRLLGERAVCASGGGEALEYLKHEEQPKFVLLDLMMPEVDGFAVLRAIRADPELAGLPVVVFSGAGDRELRQALGSGADDYMRKGSVGIDDIRDRLSRFGGQAQCENAARHRAPARHPSPGARVYCQNPTRAGQYIQ